MMNKYMPIGIESFQSVIENCYYVDKTDLIEKIAAMPTGSVLLFTRPRRFGKSLTLSMLDTFFNEKVTDANKYFKDTKIRNYKDYHSLISSSPVIHISMKDAVGKSFQELLSNFKKEISKVYESFVELENSEQLTSKNKEVIKEAIEGKLKDDEYPFSLKYLTEYIYKAKSKAPIILIDEYDCPIQAAYDNDFYDDAISFFRLFYSSALKGNKCFEKAILTGIMQIAKESMFSGLNNVIVNSVLDTSFDEYFGFTQEEVDKLLSEYGLIEKREIAKEWYDGYLFGNKRIYNPWSILNFVQNQGEIRQYWVNTGENRLLQKTVENADESTLSLLQSICNQEEVTDRLDFAINYHSLPYEKKKAFLSLLLCSGYLTTKENLGFGIYTVKIPNKEIESLFQEEIIKGIQHENSFTSLLLFKNDFLKGNVSKIEEYIEKHLLTSFSYFDFSSEKNYQIMLLTLSALFFEDAIIKSESNQGDGRCDISISPLEKGKPGIIMEIKNYKGNVSSNRLEQYSIKALSQIEKNNYQEELVNRKASPILLYGIAFSKKKIKISKKQIS